MLRIFVSTKLRGATPLDFDQAKAAVYDQVFWPMAAHMAFAVQPSAVARLDFVMEIAGLMEGEHVHVADLGCGPGVVLCKILTRKPSWTGQGLDISRPATNYAIKLAEYKKIGDRARFSVGDLTNLPYPDSSFDLVVASEALEHVPEIQTALKELGRVLRPRGKVVFTVPLESHTALHVHCLTGPDDVRRLCDEAGLAIRRLEIRRDLGFGDDWRHAFVVAVSGEGEIGNRFVKRPWCIVNTYAPA
jgi:SAM-dependent methyltransferase